MRNRLWAWVLAAAILGAAVVSFTWREWLPLPNNHLGLSEHLDQQERQEAVRERAERLREDLARENVAGRKP